MKKHMFIVHYKKVRIRTPTQRALCPGGLKRLISTESICAVRPRTKIYCCWSAQHRLRRAAPISIPAIWSTILTMTPKFPAGWPRIGNAKSFSTAARSRPISIMYGPVLTGIARSRTFSPNSQNCAPSISLKKRALEMAARCVVETDTATLYRAIHAWADEPVLKEITDHIRSDEVRHYKYFYKYFHKYNAIERNGRRTVLKTLMRRAFELRDADTEITLRHAFFARHPETAGDCAQFRPVAARVNKGVRRHLPAEMCVKMLLKPLALPAWLQPVVQYPATKLTQYVLLR